MSTVTTLGVTGMTCGNCVAHVTKDLEAVDEAGYEVASVEVQQDALAAQYAEQAADKQEAHDCACGCGTEPAADAAPATKTYDLQVPPRA